MNRNARVPQPGDLVRRFRITREIGRGTYGCVYEAVDVKDGSQIALKRILPKSEKEGFPITAVREIKALSRLENTNIVRLLDVIFDGSEQQELKAVYMVFPYVEHDLVGFTQYRRKDLSLSEVKCLSSQILVGLKYLHSRHIIHRDLKLANLLINANGVVKIADFGLSRLICDVPFVVRTNKVVTRWHRSPELLIGATQYDYAVDIWSYGTILAEILTGSPLFPGESEVHVLKLIFETIGPPSGQVWAMLKQIPDSQHILYEARQTRCVSGDIDSRYSERSSFRKLFDTVPESGCELLIQLLQYVPSGRISANEALNHLFFKEEPMPCTPNQIALPPEPRREMQVKEDRACGRLIPYRARTVINRNSNRTPPVKRRRNR